MTRLDDRQLDRVGGTLLGLAAGDALGAGYEFGPPLPAGTPVWMRGGGSFDWAPGEWTDDTSMAVPIATAAAAGLDLRTPAAQDRIAGEWFRWARTASDVGVQTRAVLAWAGRRAENEGRATPGAQDLRAGAAAQHEQTGRSGGNGSLMRTAPVALAYLHDPESMIAAAVSLSALTHWDPEAGEACALWCLAIRHAVLTGAADVRVGLPTLPAERRTVWSARFDIAEQSTPDHFRNNGWVVEALQAAWCAIATNTDQAEPLRAGLEAAVRGGGDTDTVAAIAGGLLGAAHGARAVPSEWRSAVHGWPGLDARQLLTLAETIVG